ncbi:MAG: AMP-binding protein [Nitrospirae bacterium]|nr:AMP-binding protein [Nitrospirota bacterium]
MKQLHHAFIGSAKKFGSKTAFIDRNTGRNLTYWKALRGALILSGEFRKFEDKYIGVMLPTSAGCALSIIAALMSGKAPVMINYSTGAHGNTLYARNKCGFKTVVTSRKLLQKIDCPAVEGMVFIEDIMRKISTLEKIRAALISLLPAKALMKMTHAGSGDDVSVILFTSGSEKEPKAVQLTHGNILSNLKAASDLFGFTCDDRMLACLPYFHVFGLTVALWLPLYHGMTIITYANPLDYKAVSSIIREERPTMTASTPSFLSGYLRKSLHGDFESLKYVVCGADKCPEALRKGYLEKHGIVLYEGYGTTETSPVISVNAPSGNRPGSAGRAMPGVEVRIENFETGKECPVNEEGKIMVRGGLVMKGYFNDPEETSMRISNGWYDTGDAGYLDEDGYLWHTGRLKRFVKIGGEMVSLAKTEDVLQRLLPQGAECCVVGIPDQAKGAKIIAAVSENIDENMALEKMSAELPNIALPKKFVVIEPLPKLGSGKIDFRSVEKSAAEMV